MGRGPFDFWTDRGSEVTISKKELNIGYKYQSLEIDRLLVETGIGRLGGGNGMFNREMKCSVSVCSSTVNSAQLYRKG